MEFRMHTPDVRQGSKAVGGTVVSNVMLDLWIIIVRGCDVKLKRF
jgi:hypothetical protein